MAKKLIGELELNRIYQRDCIEGMRLLPDDSVDLIVIDPPYNIGKDARWDKWKTVDAYVDWMTEVFKECERVLKPNGSFYFWHNEFEQIVKLQNAIQSDTSLVFKQFITVNKPKFKVFAWKDRSEKANDRNWFPNVEYLLFYTFQDSNFKQCIGTGLEEVMDDHTNFKPIKEYLVNEYNNANLTLKKANALMGYSTSGSNRAGKFFGKNNKAFEFPTKDNYEKLQTTGFFKKDYDDLLHEYQAILESHRILIEDINRKKWDDYVQSRYTFNKCENLSCVWEFAETNSGKYHPTQKPLSLIEKIIRTSSNEGDIVLDCFMGSGTTAVAAAKLKRNFIGFERESEYVEIANKRLDNEVSLE